MLSRTNGDRTKVPAAYWGEKCAYPYRLHAFCADGKVRLVEDVAVERAAVGQRRGGEAVSGLGQRRDHVPAPLLATEPPAVLDVAGRVGGQGADEGAGVLALLGGPHEPLPRDGDDLLDGV